MGRSGCGAARSKHLGVGLDQLDEHPAGRLGVNERDLVAPGALAGGAVDHRDAQRLEQGDGLQQLAEALKRRTLPDGTPYFTDADLAWAEANYEDSIY